MQNSSKSWLYALGLLSAIDAMDLARFAKHQLHWPDRFEIFEFAVLAVFLVLLWVSALQFYRRLEKVADPSARRSLMNWSGRMAVCGLGSLMVVLHLVEYVTEYR